ncbi:MAG: MFS transporter [Clostridia bacterium]|nr:MFS transporter [Clostridia bacterium]
MANNSPLDGKTYGIRFSEKIGYALGDAAGLMTFGLIGSFQQVFLNKVLLIDAGKLTILFLVARIWDAINDPLWGRIIDSRNPKHGDRYRPYLRWVSLPLAIFGVLMFVKIPGLSENQYLIWAYITYIGYGMLYTAVNIPYGSLASVITTDPGERSALSMFRSIGAGLGGTPAQILLPMFVYKTVLDANGQPIIDARTMKAEKVLDPTKMLIAVVILAVFSVLVYQLCYKLTRERVHGLEHKKDSNVMETIKALVKNRAFVMLCIASMLLIAAQFFTQSMYNYLFIDYFKEPSRYSLFTVFTYLPMAMLLPVLQKLVRRFGKKEICAVGMLFSAIAYFVLWAVKTTSVWVFLGFCFLAGLGMTFFVLEIWALVTDVIDHHDRMTGRREEGTAYAFFSFTRKLGQTVAGVLGTQMLEWINYDETAVTVEAVNKMYSLSTILPAVMCLIMALSLGLFYPLSKKKLQELSLADAQKAAAEEE